MVPARSPATDHDLRSILRPLGRRSPSQGRRNPVAPARRPNAWVTPPHKEVAETSAGIPQPMLFLFTDRFQARRRRLFRRETALMQGCSSEDGSAGPRGGRGGETGNVGRGCGGVWRTRVRALNPAEEDAARAWFRRGSRGERAHKKRPIDRYRARAGRRAPSPAEGSASAGFLVV